MTNDTAMGALFTRNLAFFMLLLLPVAALGTRFGLWPWTLGLGLFALSLVISLAIQIISAIWMLRRPGQATKTTLRWASLLALPPLILIAVLLRSGDGERAPIHNISTDTQSPPEFAAAIEQRGKDSNSLEYTDEIAIIQQQLFPDVKPISSELAPAAAFARALFTAESLGWEVYAQDARQGHIEAVQTTLWFGFKDDIVIRIRAEESGSRIDLRSVSRVGRSDLGANAKRILAFTERFNSAE